MIQADVGDEAHVRTDDVGAIQAAAQAYFYDGHVHLRVGKVLQGQGGGQLEKRGVQRLEKGALLLDEADDVILGHGHAIDPYALAEVHEVGRRVESHAVAGALQDGSQRVRTGTLAVGACHVDGAVQAMRAAEVPVKRPRSFQPFLVGSRAYLLKHRRAVIQIL